MAAPKKDIAKTKDDLPDFLKGKMDDGRGSEEVGAEDLVIPRIELVQGLKGTQEGRSQVHTWRRRGHAVQQRNP